MSQSVVRKVMPELDTLRGIAVLMVFMFHAFGFLVGPYQLSNYSLPAQAFLLATWFGWMGVNLFFVLSGFLITGILLESRISPNYFSRFYVRRSLRILPAYYFVLFMLPLVGFIPHFRRHVGLAFVSLAAVYLANMVEFFGVQMQYGPLWSLAVEEHFYMLWPSVVKSLTSRRLLWVAIALIAISPALRVWTPGVPGVTWKNLDGLAMGSVLALIARLATRKGLTWMAIGSMALGFAALSLGLLLRIHTSTDKIGVAFTITFTDLFFFGMVTSFLLLGTSYFSKWVNISWLKFYGFISYGLYLLHMLLFEVYDAWRGETSLDMKSLFLRCIAVLAAASMICYISRITFESWFLRLKDAPKEKAVATAAE